MTDEKNLIPKGQSHKPPQLHNTGVGAGSLIDQALGRLTKEQTEHLMAKAGETALDLEKKKIQQHLYYEMGKIATEDHITTFDNLDKRGRFTTHKVSSDIKTGAGKMNIESKSGDTCFVSSVAYADPNHPDVVFLREYRDGVLINSTIGRRFVDWYWRNGPRLAKVVKKSKTLQTASRYLIESLYSF